MNPKFATDVIKKKFSGVGSPAKISTLNGEYFDAERTETGVKVSNLEGDPFLAWKVVGMGSDQANWLIL
jgi:hypothetical protein